MPQCSVNGTTLEYVEAGAGEPVVFVHGTAGDYRTWHNQADQFSRQYHTYAYSRRYHWPNDRCPDGADYSMPEHAGDLAAFLETVVGRPAHLVGHSYGGFVCLLAAIQRAELVRSLVLAEPPVITLFVSSSPSPGELLRLLFSRPRTALAIIKFGATGAEPARSAAERGDMDRALAVSGKAVLGKEFFANLSEERWQQCRDNNIRAEYIGSGFAPLDDGDVRAVTHPVLLINGERSPSLFHRLNDRLEELLPDVQRANIPRASHIMHEDNVAAYNEALLTFLKS